MVNSDLTQNPNLSTIIVKFIMIFLQATLIGNENDFDLSDVIKNAVGQLKNSPHSRLHRPRYTSVEMPKYKHPC